MGPVLTRLTIWLAIGGYVVATLLLLRDHSRPRPGRQSLARALWTAGCVSYLVHVVCAYHYYYDWSHATALAETARQTAALTGFESGSGLYLNHLFTVVWVIDTLFWWMAGKRRYRERSRWAARAVHGFFLFMIVNGTVIFGRGPVQWYGGTLVVLLAAAAVFAYCQHRVAQAE